MTRLEIERIESYDYQVVNDAGYMDAQGNNLDIWTRKVALKITK